MRTRICALGIPAQCLTHHRTRSNGHRHFAAPSAPSPQPTPIMETVFRCTEAPTPVAEVIASLSANALATIFKHGRGLDGYLKDFGSNELSMQRRESDGVMLLHATEAGRVALASDPSLVAVLEQSKQAMATGAPSITGTAAEVAALVAQIRTLWEEGDTSSYKPMNDVYLRLYQGAQARERVKYADFLTFITAHPEHFWVMRLLMKPRQPHETEAPPLPAGTAGNYYRVTTAHSGNNYGGWGSLVNVPTAADVFEILKFVPINWGNLGSIQIPPDIKKRHVRVASILQWFRRQPKYFEVRNVAGTVEVRRSVLLHPTEHGFATREAAEQWLDARIFAGEHNIIVSTPSATSVVGGSATAGTVTSTTLSAAESALYKFVLRVCPGYYVPSEIIFKRYSKKHLTFHDMHNVMVQHPQQFEAVALQSGDVVYRRYTTGGSSATNRCFPEAIAELNSDGPQVAKSLLALMSHSCSLWDRPEYLYVRLPDEAKLAVGGYDGMLQLMRSKPKLFFVGEQFYCRNDLSNPLATGVEPVGEEGQAVVLVEENPYLTPREVAQVFHYVCPADQSVPVSHFVECSSPAMRCILPPRIMSLIELFPSLFSWREVQTGVFTVRKVVAPSAACDGLSSPTHSGSPSAGGLEGNDVMAADETIDEVYAVVPGAASNGVEMGLLQSWLSKRVNEAVVAHFGSLARLLNTHPNRFVVKTSSAGEKTVRRVAE